MGTSTAPWAHRVLSPCSYRFNTPSIISPLLILSGRACSALRLQPGLVSPFASAKNGEPDTLVFLQTGSDIVVLAGERWRQLKPRRNFLRIAVRREDRARAITRRTHRSSCSPYCYRAFGAGVSRGDIYSRHGGAMPTVSGGETL